MSFFISPLVEVGLTMSFKAVSGAVYYTAAGIWWLGKRMMYGRQPTTEEQLIEEVRLLRQEIQEKRP